VSAFIVRMEPWFDVLVSVIQRFLTIGTLLRRLETLVSSLRARYPTFT
jgi:hypothetical protein